MYRERKEWSFVWYGLKNCWRYSIDFWLTSRFAPLWINALALLTQPRMMAWCSGVRSSLSLMSTSMPGISSRNSNIEGYRFKKTTKIFSNSNRLSLTSSSGNFCCSAFPVSSSISTERAARWSGVRPPQPTKLTS